MSESQDVSNLNLNPARQDKFFFAIGNIPTISLLEPAELTDLQQQQFYVDEKNFFHLSIKDVNLPSVSLGESVIGASRFVNIKDTNHVLNFETLTTKIKLDRNYTIYKMLILWLFMLKNPEGYNKLSALQSKQILDTSAILTLNDNFNKPVISFEYYDLRPLSIPGINFSYANDGAEIELDIIWQYTYFMPRTSGGKPYNLEL